MEIQSNLVYRKKYKEEEKALMRENLVFATINFVNSLDVGQSLPLSSLADEVRAIDERVTGLGSSRVTIFDNVFIHYPARLETSRKRREKLIQGAINIAPNARIIIEPSITRPITYV